MEDIGDVAQKVYMEGIGDAIQGYYGRDLKSNSNELNDAWAIAFDALEEVGNLLPEVEES